VLKVQSVTDNYVSEAVDKLTVTVTRKLLCFRYYDECCGDRLEV
jgi:hypothetical protein